MEDFLLLDELLSDESKLMRESTREFINREVKPIIGDAFEKAQFPMELIQKIGEMGLLGCTLPEKYGGLDSNYMSYGIINQELERGDSGIRSFVSTQSSLCMFPIFSFGSEEQKKKYLPKLASAELIACFGLTEPDGGSDLTAMDTRAEKTTDGWIVNGTKSWSGNALFADLAVVWAQTEEGIRGFLIEKEFNGFQRIDLKKKMSLRASGTGVLVMENCFVPEENCLPHVKGTEGPRSCLNQAQYAVAWGVIGAAIDCYEMAVQYTTERKQFGKPIASFQLIQKDLSKMLTEITKAQLMNVRLGQLKDEGKDTPDMTSMAKMNACKEALAIARLSRNLLGANGISLEYPVIRHMINLESTLTSEGANNFHQLVLGEHITGFNALS
ncbi:MAG: acyl-CoA dehydrogenase family protein [SAR324 cluster bacterium]|nr:acyl-CoA dehydrogenase family protein [SAR324 cluster bacterium]